MRPSRGRAGPDDAPAPVVEGSHFRPCLGLAGFVDAVNRPAVPGIPHRPAHGIAGAAGGSENGYALPQVINGADDGGAVHAKSGGKLGRGDGSAHLHRGDESFAGKLNGAGH